MSNVFETDVLIVGGGPAGSSTALGLLKYSSLKVTLLEQGDLNTLRVGEQVNASIFDLLAYLGIERKELDQKCFLPGYDSLAAWGSPNLSSRHSVFSTQIDSYQLDRTLFDLFLLEKAAENGAVVLPRSKAFAFTENGYYWRVSVKHETRGNFFIQARYLVDASGRQSNVCRKAGAVSTKFDSLVATGAFLRYKNEQPIRQEILLETVEDGWWYFAVLPDNQVVISLFSDSDIVKEKQLQKPEIWIEALTKTKHVRTKLGNAMVVGNHWVRNAFSHLTDSAALPNFLAVGDAAASFDPISSLGIGFALSAACHAAKAISDHQNNDNALINYKLNIDSIFNNYLQTKALFYQKEQRWNDSPFWARRNVLEG